jgi:hypothetical protein
MSSESPSFGYYLRHSTKEISKAILFGLLLFAGLLVAIIVRLASLDGVTIFMSGMIVEIIAFIVIFYLSKKGFLYVIPREEDFEQHGPKKTRKKIED